jgi:hypothetical protein
VLLLLLLPKALLLGPLHIERRLRLLLGLAAEAANLLQRVLHCSLCCRQRLVCARVTSTPHTSFTC